MRKLVSYARVLAGAFFRGVNSVQGEWGGVQLLAAVECESLSSVKVLLARGAPVGAMDSFGWTPLHHAARWDLTRIVKALLEAGADPNVTAHAGGTTPAFHARTPEMLAMLLEAGARSDIEDSHGFWPFEQALSTCYSPPLLER